MRCPQCGSEITPGQKFCGTCGATLLPSAEELPRSPSDEVQAPPLVPYPPIEQVPQPYYPQQHPAQPPRPRNTARLALAIAVVTVLLVAPAILVVIAILGSTSRAVSVDNGVAPTQVAISPTLALERASSMLNSTPGLHYEGEVAFFGVDQPAPTVTGTNSSAITISGDIKPPQDFTFKANIERLGQYIVIGPDSWHRATGSEPWQHQATTDYSLGLANPLTFLQYMRYYKSGSPQQIGSEQQQGVLVHRVRFDVDTERLAAATDDPSLNSIYSSSSISVDVWVRDGSDEPQSMLVSVEQQGGQSVSLRVTFSKLGQPVQISPPAQ